MTRVKLRARRAASVVGLSALVLAGVAPPAIAAPPTRTVVIDASDTYVVPAFVTSLKLTVVGAAGGWGSEAGTVEAAPGGAGAAVVATLDVHPNDVLDITVGQIGSDSIESRGGGLGGVSDAAEQLMGGDGGDGATGGTSGGGGGGGGGATAVRRANASQWLIVAGGGGGGGGAGFTTDPDEDSWGGEGGGGGSNGYSGDGGAGGERGRIGVAAGAAQTGADAVAGTCAGGGGGGGGGYPTAGGGGRGGGNSTLLCTVGGGGGGGAGGSSYVGGDALPVVVIEAGPDEAGRVEIEETYTYGSSVRLEFTTDVLTGQTNVVAGVVSTDDGSEPVGTVTFTATNKDTGQVRPLGSPAVGAGGMASVSVALPAGRYRIDAVFTPAAGSTVTGSRASTDDPGMSDYLVRQAGVTLVVDQPPTVLMARQPVTVGAALVPELGAVGEMSGWVQFSVDGSPVGGPVRVTGQRVEIVTRLSAGTHQVTASYTGDECFSSAVSSAVEWVVSQAPTTTVLRVWRPSADTTDLMVADVSVNAPAWADVAPSGSVSIYDSATSLLVAGPVLVDATGMARLSLTLAQGNHPLFAVYGGDDDFRVSSSDVVVAVVDGQATAVNVQADPSPAHRGDTVRITAQVSGVPGGALTGRTPTGTVKFAIDGVGRGPDQTLDAEGRATLMVDGLGVGTHTVTVSYLGGGGFAKSAGTYALRVLQSETGRPTRAELVTWASHPDTSGVVPVDIVVTGPSGEDRVPDGTVTVFDGSGDRKVAGPIALDPNGRARASLELARGQHFLYAVYSGSLGFAGSTTQVVLVDVAGRPTLSELKVWTSSPDTSDAVLVDVTVINPSGDSLVPDGAVEVFDASGERQVAGPVRLDPDGRARAALILAGGRHLLYAVYTGGDRFDGSTTQVVPVDVAGRATTLTLGASGSPVVRGDPVLVSALVAEAVGGTLPGSALTGSVQFAVDGLGIGAISAVDGSGVARFVSEALPVGTHTISAEYLGDQSHAASKATVEVVVVAPPRVAAVSLSATKKKDSVSGRVHVTVSSVALQDGYRLGHRKVEFFVNGKRVGSVRTDVKGQASYTIPHAKLKLGKNPILVRHNAGSSAFQPTVAATLSVTVQRLRPVSLKIKPEWHPRSREVVVTVKANTLVDGYKHNGRLVTATARGTSVATARTNRNGVAVLVIPIRDLKVGVNPLKVIFNSGSGRYRPVFSTTWLIERLPNGTATITKASKP